MGTETKYSDLGKPAELLLIFLNFYGITGFRELDMIVKQQEIVLRKVAILLE